MATSVNQSDFVKTALRLPPELHAQMHAAAQESGRSYNAELVARLAGSLESEGGGKGSEAQQQLIRLLGYSLGRLADLNPNDSPDAADLRASLRNLAIMLGNGDVKGAGVEASSLVFDRENSIYERAKRWEAEHERAGAASVNALIIEAHEKQMQVKKNPSTRGPQRSPNARKPKP